MAGQKAVNVLLSREETYADISPIRLNSNGVTAFVSIMRVVTICVFLCGAIHPAGERSRDAHSIVKEVKPFSRAVMKKRPSWAKTLTAITGQTTRLANDHFAQLLEMVALYFPAAEGPFLHLPS